MRKLWSHRIYSAPIALLIGLLLLWLAIYLSYDDARAFYRQDVSKDWPTTAATLTAVWRNYSRAGGIWTEVEYKYAVNGAMYHGETWDLPHLSYTGLQRTIAQGQRVAVHYNPQRPGISVLDPGLPWRRIPGLVVVVPCAAILGLLFIAGGFAGMRKKLEKRLRPYRGPN